MRCTDRINFCVKARKLSLTIQAQNTERARESSTTVLKPEPQGSTLMKHNLILFYHLSCYHGEAKVLCMSLSLPPLFYNKVKEVLGCVCCHCHCFSILKDP